VPQSIADSPLGFTVSTCRLFFGNFGSDAGKQVEVDLTVSTSKR